jgi:hypothetical protein
MDWESFSSEKSFNFYPVLRPGLEIPSPNSSMDPLKACAAVSVPGAHSDTFRSGTGIPLFVAGKLESACSAPVRDLPHVLRL